MAHAQKPNFFFPRNGRVHLNLWGRQFSRLLAAEVCTSALVMLDTPCSVMAREYWLPIPFVSFPFTSPPMRHCVPSGSERALYFNYDAHRIQPSHIIQHSHSIKASHSIQYSHIIQLSHSIQHSHSIRHSHSIQYLILSLPLC